MKSALLQLQAEFTKLLSSTSNDPNVGCQAEATTSRPSSSRLIPPSTAPRMDDLPQLSSFVHLEQYKELCTSLLGVLFTQDTADKQAEYAETKVQWQLCGLVSSAGL